MPEHILGSLQSAADVQMTSDFAFMIHPIEPQRDVARKFPLLGKLPPGVIDYFSRFFPPYCLSRMVGIRSEATDEEIEGWLIACPLTPKRLLGVPLETAYAKIVQTGRVAERLGARILGLGAFTSVVGDAGLTVSRELSIPVTTGNSYTVALVVEALLAAAECMGLDLGQSVVAVVGAYGSVGRACAQLLARSIPHLVLIGRKLDRLQEVQAQVASVGADASISTELEGIRQANMVLGVTSAVEAIIEPGHLQPGAVVCDVARPRNVSRRVAEERDDVLVIEGGVVKVPGRVDFGFDFGLPPGQAYACMAETMLLALEGRYECFSIGRDISLERVDEISRLATRHGFRLAGFRSFERVLSGSEIGKIIEKARQQRRVKA